MKKVTVEGLARAMAQLRNFGAAQGASAAGQAAEDIAREAASLAPGRLGEAISGTATQEGGEVRMPGFARFVEFGTRKMAAQPFLRPAIERVRGWMKTGGGHGGGRTGSAEGAL